jgi:hypothetical protein
MKASSAWLQAVRPEPFVCAPFALSVVKRSRRVRERCGCFDSAGYASYAQHERMNGQEMLK